MSSRFEAWEEREGTMLAVMPYALLGVCAVFTAVSDLDSWRDLVIDAGLAAATGAWMFWWIGLQRECRAERLGLAGVYFVGLVALMVALVVRAPWYGFFTFTGYFSVILLLGRWKPVGVLAIAAVTAMSQAGGPPSDAGELAVYVVILAINVSVAGAVIFFAHVGEEQRARLEASLKENEVLHAQLLEQARDAGVLDERQRLARELHDTLAQGLAGIITQLEAAERDPRHLHTARQLARDSLTEARRSVHALRPEPLETARLPDALAGEARRWSALHEIPTEVTTTGVACALRPEIEVTVLRAAQEALANVAKHARAQRVGLTLSYMGDLVTLDVRDDGVGFRPHEAPNGDGGFGLVAMRQRVHGLAGTLEIESEPGAGTALSVSVPAIGA